MIARERELVIRAIEFIEHGEQDAGLDLLHDLLKPVYPRCIACGGRFPTHGLMERHRTRDCCGLAGGRRWSE
jgi:hypothetical protein